MVGKIFEEGIKNAQAVIVIVSKNSVEKAWVREELNAALVKKINHGSLLIPVIIDNCEVPEALKSTLWSSISDLGNYEAEFERIVSAIFGRREKPPLGSPPRYTRVVADTIPGLTEIDAHVFVRACELRIKNQSPGIQVAELFNNVADLQIPQQDFLESIDILDRKGYIEGTKVIGGSIPFFQISHYGFDQYLRRVFSGYENIYEQVCLAILNENLTQNVEIAQRLNQSISIIDHVMKDLSNRGLVHAEGFLGGGLVIFNVYPELKRMFRR